MPHMILTYSEPLTVFSAPETPEAMIGAVVRYYQTQKDASGCPRIIATGVIIDMEYRYGVLNVRIEPANQRLITRWHIADDAIIRYIWTGGDHDPRR